MNDFITNKNHATCNINQSIVHHIHLLNTTYFGECTFDTTFGCSIWDIDFDNLKNLNFLKENIKNSLYESLMLHEKRLSKIAVDVKIKQEEILEPKVSNRIKKRVSIKITGKIKKTNENFSYVEQFYIGPLSY
jgi:phage baseplate assembly protein W